VTRVLVADDDPANIELLAAFLESKGYKVATALDGNRAVELGTTGDFQVAILDVHMPMYDGIEVLQILRRRHVLHPIKILALTGDATEEVRADLVLAGIDAYMVKPVDLSQLLAKLEELAPPAT
jgi:CheY-like chemotaxis protein